jgi:hypothetical protein
MKTSAARRFHRLLRALLPVVVAALTCIPTARAGLTLEMNLIRYDQFGYYFFPNLGTNSNPPAVPFGDYYIGSPGAPTNGSFVVYQFTTNGFNQVTGSTWDYGDFDSMLHELTNGNWSLYFTNTVTTNIYHFTVTANLTSNDMPIVSITFPTNGAVNVTNQPTFTWQGPTNYSDVVVYEFNNSVVLSGTQTSWLSGSVLYEGLNSVTVHYDNYPTNAVVASVPTNTASQPISSWVSTTHLQDYISSQFTVGTVDTSGTSHTLVAHYPWDGTNADGTASGADTSGNGYNMNFGGGYGAQGGVNSVTNAAVGPRAIQFHDGDANSAGYVGGNPTPAPLLTPLAGSFSISCWIKTTQNNFGWDQAPAYYGAGIVSADNNGLANDVIPLALTGSTIGFNTGGDVEDVTLNSVASVNDGNFHHVVVTRNQGTGQKIIYIDGMFDSFSSGTTNLLSDPQKLTIGALADAADPNANDFNYYNGFDGEVDDLQIYAGVLSAGEVAALYANPGSTSPNGGGFSGGHRNVAHYAFDNSGNLGQDTSGNGNDLSGPTWWGPVHQFSTNAEAGGGAIQFFGTSDLNADGQVLTNLNGVLAGSFTISAWVKTTVTNGADYNNAFYGAAIFWAYNDQGNTNDTIPLSITGSKVAFTTRDHLGNFDTLHSLSSVNDGTYHLITATRDQASGQKKIYVDGHFETSENGTTDPLNGDYNNLTLGGYAYCTDGYCTNFYAYNGLLDDVQVYTGVLSGSDVAYLYSHPGSNVVDTTGDDFNSALNTTGLTWTTGGDAHWFVETTNTHDTVSAAQSGSVTNNQTSTIQTTVTGPGTIAFWWQNPTFNNLDLEFDLDGNYQYDIGSGSTDWAQFGPSPIPPGQHTLSWTVFANGDGDPSQAAYLDEVTFIPDTAPVITLNPFDQTNYSGYGVALLAAATSNGAITWQWFKVGSALPIPGATNALFVPTNSGTASVAGSYYGLASNPAGSANTTTAVVSFVTATLPPDWSVAFKTPFANSADQPTTNYGIACLLDSAGNLYAANSFTRTNAFGTNTLGSGESSFSTALLKQTASGTPIWARGLTNNGAAGANSYPQCLAPAPGDGVYLSGVFARTNWLGTNQLVDTAGATVYLARFDSNGNPLWVRTLGGTNIAVQSYHQLVSDPSGNVTISALGQNTTSVGNSNVVVNGQNGVLAQFDANGNVRWVQAPSGWFQYLTYNTGRIYGSMGGGQTNVVGGLTNTSDRNWCLVALNATNGQAVWLRNIGSALGQGVANDMPNVAVSGTNVFLVGSGAGSNAAFGAFSVSWPVANGQYFARYDTNGTAQLAVAFGSSTTTPWASVADASGNVYVGGDFDTYSFFGNDLIAAPRNEAIGTDYHGQTFVAKFDRNGNPLWARPAQSPTSYVNLRDLALANDGIWSCGFLNQSANFGTNVVYGPLACLGFPLCTLQFHVGGWMAKITDSPAAALPVTLLNPQHPGGTFQFSFTSQSGFTHAILYRTNLSTGTWQTNSSVAGDGTLKTINVPLSVFGGAKQGFIRVSTQ